MRYAATLVLIVAVSLFCVHEMDAVTHSEWRLLPLLSDLQDETARDMFVMLHIPMFVFLFWAVFVAPWKLFASLVFDFAMIGHATVHFRLQLHPDYSFVPPLETITVYGTAAMCLLHVFLVMLPQSQRIE